MSKRQRVDSPPATPVVPLIVPRVANAVALPSDRLSRLPSVVVTLCICDFFDIEMLCCLQAANRTLFHAVQRHIGRRPNRNMLHLARLLRHHMWMGWASRHLQAAGDYTRLGEYACNEVWFYDSFMAQRSPNSLAKLFAEAQKRFLDRFADGKPPVVDIFWSKKGSPRNILIMLRSDVPVSDDHMRVMQAGMKSYDQVIQRQDPRRFRVLHATPESFGGPLQSEFVVVDPERFELEGTRPP